MKKSRCAAMILVVVFAAIAVAGCGQTQEKKNSESTAVTQPQQTQNQSTEEKKEPVKLTMFLSNAGFPIGDGNISDNPYIKVVEDMANVKLEITYPEMADVQTKFDLMMASSNIPDLIHYYVPQDIQKYGQSGAFLPVNDIIGKSPVLSKMYTPEILDAQKAPDGNIYGVYAQDAKVPNTTIARLDLIDSLNGGKVPATPDEWYDFMKKVKANNPAAVPYSSQGQLIFMDVFFKAYGIDMDFGAPGWQLQGDKVISALEHPRMKEAVEFHKKLYSEKLIDQQFVANKGQDWVNRIMDNDMCVWNSGPFSFNWVNSNWGTTKKVYDKITGFVPHPVAPGVDPKDVYFRYSPIGGHTISISKKCTAVDAAVKTIEAFVSPELQKAASWGIENVDYTVKDGKNVPNPDVDSKTSWRGAYLFMFQYWTPDAISHSAALTAAAITDEGYRQKFLDNVDKSLPIAKQEMDSVGYKPFSLMPQTEAITTKLTESQTLAQSIISKAIVGNITMDQFDQEVKKFMEKYKDITDAYQKYYDSNKALVQKLINK